MSIELDPKIPDGELGEKWHNWLDGHRLVGPRNRNEYKVIVVGTGLAGEVRRERRLVLGHGDAAGIAAPLGDPPRLRRQRAPLGRSRCVGHRQQAIDAGDGLRRLRMERGRGQDEENERAGRQRGLGEGGPEYPRS